MSIILTVISRNRQAQTAPVEHLHSDTGCACRPDCSICAAAAEWCVRHVLAAEDSYYVLQITVFCGGSIRMYKDFIGKRRKKI